ncbi:integral peroxisomal membrane peroxin-domain-containing protein [Xylariales sp. PMI_506]|nr:integral peroxisomal membrane peroxin-domain-containing protein [Xylariales sp. PMI_506]
MSTPKSATRGVSNGDAGGLGSPSTTESNPIYGAAPPQTYAAFSSSNISTAATAAKRRSTILVHQKSPLLLATPPQVTRALAYSHPFLLPLNKLVGLLSWTTGDPWESFLLVVVFWATVQYGDVVVRWAGPIITVLGIIAGMYARRYSPLSSSGWSEYPSWSTGKGSKAKSNSNSTTSSSGGGGGAGGGGTGSQHQRNNSEVTNTRHQKTLDEIVETVKVFTTRCNILLEPMLEMTDFLSTQRTATSATTRPALTTLFVRILAITPFWVALTLPPLRIITTKRVVLVFGTLVLTWHSRVCRVSRALIWRSAAVRRVARWVTGLEFEGPTKPTPKKPDDDIVTTSKDKDQIKKTQPSSALTAALRTTKSSKDAGVRFTFIIYENQRRWVGLGWTSSLFAYERSAWTDEHNNPVPPRDEFELPEVEDGPAKWRWVKGSNWRVDGAGDVQDESEYDGEAGKNGWIYYDNKWNNGRRGQDGWGRWTRRRKWYRDAELVEVDDDENLATPVTEGYTSPPPPELPPRIPAESSQLPPASEPPGLSTSLPSNPSSDTKEDEFPDNASLVSTSSKSTRFWLPGPPSLRRRATGDTTKRSRRTSEVGSLHDADRDADSNLTPALELAIQGSRKEQDSWGVGDEVTMGLE